MKKVKGLSKKTQPSPQTDTENRMAIARVKRGEGGERGQGAGQMVAERDLTLGGERRMHYADDVL